MSIRESGKKTLKTVLNIEKNIEIIEKAIYGMAGDDENKYKSIIYDVVGDIISKRNLKDILKSVKDMKIGWEHTSFDTIKFRQKEQDEFIVNPFQVEEGALECKKCGSKRTFSYSKQVRSCDEPMTTFAQCIACKSKWTYSG
jgi:DNA-directed RNA polymerase subunit M/transcription elongation factor TFIIS